MLVIGENNHRGLMHELSETYILEVLQLIISKKHLTSKIFDI